MRGLRTGGVEYRENTVRLGIPSCSESGGIIIYSCGAYLGRNCVYMHLSYFYVVMSLSDY